MRRTRAGLVCGCVALAVSAPLAWTQTPPQAVAAPGGTATAREAAVLAAVKSGKPSDAESEAEALVAVDSKLAPAWAIVAASSLSRGLLVDAVTQIGRAGELDDRDPFVQKTAGSILGTLDASKPDMPDRIRAQINTLRHNMKGEAPFDEAYASATKAETAKLAAAAAATVSDAPPMVYAPEVVNVWVAPDDAPAFPQEPATPLVPGAARAFGSVDSETPWWAGDGGIIRTDRLHRPRNYGRSRGFGFVTGFDFDAQGRPIFGGSSAHAAAVFRSLPAPGTLAAPAIQHIQPMPGTISVGPSLPPPTGAVIPHPIVPPPPPPPRPGATGRTGRPR